jgi:hypothetical protein
MSDYFSILSNLGYKLQNNNCGYWRCQPLYRDSDSPSIAISSQDGHLVDFAHPENSGSFKKLIALTLGKPISKVDEYLKSKKYEESAVTKDEVDLSNTYASVFDIDQFGKILPIHDYWVNRGVPENIIKHFRGGIIKGKTRLWGRYILPIFARDGQTVNGFAARKLNDSMKGPKWICSGHKSEWAYPLFLTEKHIKQKKEIVILESFGDVCAAATIDVRATIAPIGISSFSKLASLCIEFDPDEIIIAFNNDLKSNAGNKAAERLQKCLLNFFNKNKVKIRLPQTHNDLGEMLQMGDRESLLKWYEYAKN